MYLLDANVFIEAKNRHYGFEFCPAFWDWLVRENITGRVASVRKIAEELQRGSDRLADWAKEQGEGFFLQPDDAVQKGLRTVIERVSEQSFPQVEIAKFLQAGDCWLIAHALTHKGTVVTHEKMQIDTLKVKIPNICNLLSLSCVDPFEMLNIEKARFVLSKYSITH